MILYSFFKVLPVNVASHSMFVPISIHDMKSMLDRPTSGDKNKEIIQIQLKTLIVFFILNPIQQKFNKKYK